MEPKGYEQWYGNWTYMVVATLIFGVFTLALLRPRRKRDWRGAGILQASFISLFAEMFGFPLTILLIIGFNVQWPTFPTLIMAPILIFMYLRLVRVEDRELAEEFSTAFEVYQKNVPAFMPKIIRYR